MKVLAVIPCRYGSSRLLGKPLIKIKDKTIIEHVYLGISTSQKIDKLIIATDDERIFKTVKDFGADVVMTRKDHPTGTDRICEVVSKHNEFDIVLNIQGDEPLVDSECVDALIKPFLVDKHTMMSTLCTPIYTEEDLNNPNVVKVVKNKENKALYFSRYAIPYSRDDTSKNNRVGQVTHWKHLGLYGFKKDFLFEYRDWPQTQLEQSESLEQLRVLENGFSIHVEAIKKEMVDVNTEQDILKARKLL